MRYKGKRPSSQYSFHLVFSRLQRHQERELLCVKTVNDIRIEHKQYFSKQRAWTCLPGLNAASHLTMKSILYWSQAWALQNQLLTSKSYKTYRQKWRSDTHHTAQKKYTNKYSCWHIAVEVDVSPSHKNFWEGNQRNKKAEKTSPLTIIPQCQKSQIWDLVKAFEKKW